MSSLVSRPKKIINSKVCSILLQHMIATISAFLELVTTAVKKNELVKLTVGGKRNKEGDLKNVYVKPVILKTGNKLSFVYRHNTKDVTKNFDTAEAVAVIDKLLKNDFFNADLFTTANDFKLLQQNDKVKISKKPASHTNITTQQHDKQKQRIIKATNNIYLHKLGIASNDGVVKKEMQDKYKQINRYTEIIDGIIKELQFNGAINVVDMGSGKGYLTFALYDYLTNTLQQQANITGIEMRPDLVTICNQIAAAANFVNLHFEKGTIADAKLSSPNILIALHACDTATDDAIYKGIEANAKVIIVAPCCHKQIRRQIKPENVLSAITKHGILLERQAEMVTDTIRALLLEANGYKTKVFEFINTEHTPKNVMIAGVKNETTAAKKEESLEKVRELKAMFNIEQHYLEKLLGV